MDRQLTSDIQTETQMVLKRGVVRIGAQYRGNLEVFEFAPYSCRYAALQVLVDFGGNLVQADDDVGKRGNVRGVVPELVALFFVVPVLETRREVEPSFFVCLVIRTESIVIQEQYLQQDLRFRGLVNH